MEYSPEFGDAITQLNPQLQPDQISGAYAKMRQQFPDASEQDLADAIRSAGVVTGRAPAQGLSPNVMQGVNEYQSAQQAEQVVKQKQQELAGIDQGINTSQQNIAQLQQMINQPTGPQDLVNAQNQVQQGRNQVGENIGHIIAALGGQGVSNTYNQFIAGKRRDEQQQIQNVKDRMGAEMQTLQFQKVKDEYIETRRAIAAKYKEDADRKDPNSQISVLTRKMYTAMAESNPALQKMIPNLETMSAAEIEKHGPLFKAMVDHADKKLAMDLKVQEQAAKSSLDMQRLAKLQAETEKTKAETNKVNTEAAQPTGYDKNGNFRTSEGVVIPQKEMSQHREDYKSVTSTLEKLRQITADDVNQATSLFDYSQMGNLGKAVGNVGGKTTDAQNKIAEINLKSVMDNLPPGAASDKDIAQARSTFPGYGDKAALKNWLSRNQVALEKVKTYYETNYGLGKAGSTGGVGTNQKPFVTMDQIRKAAREKGATEQEMIDHVTAKGYEVR